ncbi:unnamed protein product [Psylliodes chrysocephalus]|uniref:Uncharacterized protein n=1 Tax=Psylliodes chrysocephalus TaxID=3402493 RepID=A0A9P0CWX8_9CUCU|nr:unnamed protein product [Psylliodes chrysocephala]
MDQDESGENSPKFEKNSSTFSTKKKYVENPTEFESAYKTLKMSKIVTARILDCGQEATQSDGSTITPGTTPPGGGENITPKFTTGNKGQIASQIRDKKATTQNNINNANVVAGRVEGGSSSFRFGLAPANAEFNVNSPYKGIYNFPAQNKGAIPKTYILASDPRIQIGVRSTDLPSNIDRGIFNYNSGNATSEEEKRDNGDPQSKLPHSPNSVFPLRSKNSPVNSIQMDTENTTKELPFVTPRKFSSNFEKLIREKSRKTLTTTKNRFLPYHTYTNREEKTHAFVLRGLAEGTVIEQIVEDLQENTENQGTHNINTPILSRSASDDKSDDYVDADDNANSLTTNNKSNPIERVDNPTPPGIPSKEAPILPPNNSSTPTPQMQPFQSAYVAESQHPTKITIKRLEMPTGTRGRTLNFGPGTEQNTALLDKRNTGAIPKVYRTRFHSLENTKTKDIAGMKPNRKKGELSSLELGEATSRKAINTSEEYTEPLENTHRLKNNNDTTTDVNTDIPRNVQDSIHNFNSSEYTSEEEKGAAGPNPLANKNKPTSKTTPAATNNKKALMPPIVVDGKTVNQTALIQDLRAKIKGGFSVKHTNSSTILFVDDKDDHQRVLKSVKEENIAHHTYTTSEDKSHAFVLRGLAEGTQTQHIEDDLVAEYDIKRKTLVHGKIQHVPLE